jgi:hypothetical protein
MTTGMRPSTPVTRVGKSSVLRAGVVPDINEEARARRARSKTPDRSP